MTEEVEMQKCPWCGQIGWHFAEKDIGQSEGWRCKKCNYFKRGKRP